MSCVNENATPRSVSTALSGKSKPHTGKGRPKQHKLHDDFLATVVPDNVGCVYTGVCVCVYVSPVAPLRCLLTHPQESGCALVRDPNYLCSVSLRISLHCTVHPIKSGVGSG